MTKHPFEPRGIVGDFYSAIPSPIHEDGLTTVLPAWIPKKLYLAHNFGLRFKVRDEITPKVQWLFPNYEIHNPFLRKGRENQGIFEYEGVSEVEFAEGRKIDTDKMIVENDLLDIRSCDILVAYIETPSIGTASEFFYNSYILKRPTFAVFETKHDLTGHPWITYLSTKIIILDELNRV